MDRKQKLLIADDEPMNRDFLELMLGEDYDLDVVEDGEEAIIKMAENLDDYALLLLDLNMPKMNGIDVLRFMNENGWIHQLPTIMISITTDSDLIDQAFRLGALDYIERPYHEQTVKQRVKSALQVHESQRKLEDFITHQIIEKNRTNKLMTTILSNIVQSKSGVDKNYAARTISATRRVLEKLVVISNKYPLSKGQIDLIASASALHDIGKIAIRDEILEKKDPYTEEEKAELRKHPEEGARILEQLTMDLKEPFLDYAHEICRWHHERYDGKGFPDGLKGEEIPISAQVVGIVAAYDDLIQDRKSNTALSHDMAYQMLIDGKAGEFNPIVLKAFVTAYPAIRSEYLTEGSLDTQLSIDEARSIGDQLGVYALQIPQETYRTLHMLNERGNFFVETEKPHFSYLTLNHQLLFNKSAGDLLDLPNVIRQPQESFAFRKRMGDDWVHDFGDYWKSRPEGTNDFSYPGVVHLDDGTEKKVLFKGKLLRQQEEGAPIIGLLGSIESLDD